MSKSPRPVVRNIDGVVKPTAPMNRKKEQWNKPLVACIVVIVVLLVAVAVLLLKPDNKEQNTPPIDDVAAIKSTVGQHYLLPSDEEPAIATVTDKSKLNSSFRDKAQNDDRVLIYQKNQIAILYRPSINKVVDVTPVSIDTPKKTN